MLSSNRQGEARSALNAVQARHADILRIEQTMVELAQLFQDMAIMVEEQGETLAVIEEKAMKTEQDMEAAHVELVAAKKSALSARSKRKICFGIMVLVVLIFAGVIAYFATRNRGSSSSNSSSKPDRVVSSSTVISTSTVVSVDVQTVTQIVTQISQAPATTQPVRSSTRTALLTRASLLPRMMNFEERARAWPLVDMAAEQEAGSDLGLNAYWL
jgi:hypothetical protein